MTDRIEFTHIRRKGKKINPGNHPFGTIALRYDGTNVYLGTSVAIKGDNFNRTHGRNASIGKAKSNFGIYGTPDNFVQLFSIYLKQKNLLTPAIQNFLEVFHKKITNPR